MRANDSRMESWQPNVQNDQAKPKNPLAGHQRLIP